MLEPFMQSIAQELELPELSPTGKGEYTIPFEDYAIIIAPIQDGFSLFCNVILFPKENREKFLMHAMHANLFGQGTNGAVVGLSEDGNLLTLSKVVDYNVDYKEFRDTLEDFLNAIDYWREETLTHK